MTRTDGSDDPVTRDDDPTPGAAAPGRGRHPAAAARRGPPPLRRDGYAATTVRDIADDAGVNVALINRYFTSKEGLFEACLARRRSTSSAARSARTCPATDAARPSPRQLAGPHAAEHPNQLLLLLRSSGDERAEQIRLGHPALVRRTPGRRGRPRQDDDDQHLLRAQIALSAALGIALLRSSTTLEPLASAREDDLLGPIEDLFQALLPGS